MKQVNLFYGYSPLIVPEYFRDKSSGVIWYIDANKHPDEQINDLIKILKNNDEIIEIFSNSPYVHFRLTLISAYSEKEIPDDKIKDEMYKGLNIKCRHFEIKSDGNVIEGKYYKSMMSDDNLLNNKLAENNELFSELLDIENKLDWRKKQ